MNVPLACTAGLLSAVSIILFIIGCKLSFGIEKNDAPDHLEADDLKSATTCLTFSYVFLLAAVTAWGAAFFFSY
jgi:hypothetical protein